MAILRESKFIKTDIDANNNKFWYITMFDDLSVETHWGRVGDYGQKKKFPHASQSSADRFYDSKCREKEKKGYIPLQVVDNAQVRAVEAKEVVKGELKDLAARQIETSSPETAKLVSYLVDVNVHNILSSTTMSYDTSRGTFSTPLGVVTQSALDEARQLLATIGTYVDVQDYYNTQLTPVINRYLMLIPQNIGRGKPDPKYLYPNIAAIQRQSAILDSLEASLQLIMAAPAASGEVREPEQLFQVKLHLLEDGNEIDRIRKKYKETLQSMHQCSHLDVSRVFTVEISSMRGAFEGDGLKVGNIWELWHGTRASNLLSIMKGGFVIPPSNASYCTGRMFGNGVYFSDQSTKSLNYAWGYWGGSRDDNCFMFLCNVAMGKYYTPSGPSQNLPQAGFDSTFAEGRKSGVQNNEMIVYRTSQIDPVCLVQFSPGGR